jgi:hypothetical protein
VIDNLSVTLALRNRALSLVVCTTGSTTLSATTTGYARATGSFVTDGFVIGMELNALGFSVSGNNGARVITAASALALTCSGCAVESAGTGKTLSVGIPATRAFENVTVSPDPTRPFIEEDYSPATNRLISLPASNGTLEETGLYVLKWYGLSNTGISAIRKSVDALKALFAPGTSLTAGAHTVYVRSDTSVQCSQMLPQGNGWTVCVLTIPWRARSQNTIAA